MGGKSRTTPIGGYFGKGLRCVNLVSLYGTLEGYLLATLSRASDTQTCNPNKHGGREKDSRFQNSPFQITKSS